jgi:hypothetical protein
MPAEARNGTAGRVLVLWATWAIGPVAWTLHLMVSYLLVEWVCGTGNVWVLHGVTLATVLMAAAGGLIAWRQWTAAGRRWPGAGGDPASRTRFLAVGGLIISLLSALIILAEGIPNFILSACL